MLRSGTEYIWPIRPEIPAIEMWCILHKQFPAHLQRKIASKWQKSSGHQIPTLLILWEILCVLWEILVSVHVVFAMLCMWRLLQQIVSNFQVCCSYYLLLVMLCALFADVCMH